MDLFTDKAALAAICQKYSVERLSLFGSVLRGTASLDSDVDLLAEFDSKSRTTLIDVGNLEADLSRLLNGKKVDVRTANDLSPHFRQEVVAAADLQYSA